MSDETEPHVQVEATWCITNLASGTSEQTALIVEKGVIPIIVKLLDTIFLALLEQAIWCVRNIAGDCTIFRDKLLGAGA